MKTQHEKLALAVRRFLFELRKYEQDSSNDIELCHAETALMEQLVKSELVIAEID